MTKEGQPQGKIEKIKGITRRALIGRGISIAVGVAVGFATGKYSFVLDNPTVYNPQIGIGDQDQELSSLTVQELAHAAQRVDDLGRIVNEFVLEPFVGFNSSSIWLQNKAHIARLLGSANPKASEASWEFSDKEKVFFDFKVFNSYKEDGRLFASVISSKFGFAFMASRGLLGVIQPPMVDIGIRYPYTIIYEDRPRITSDKLREIADRWVKLPDYVKWGSLEGESPGGDERFKRWTLSATGQSGERYIEFTIGDNSAYLLKVIEHVDDTKRGRELFGTYIIYNEARDMYSRSPHPFIKKGQAKLLEVLEQSGSGIWVRRAFEARGGLTNFDFLEPPVKIHAQYVAEVFGEGFTSSSQDPSIKNIRDNNILLEVGRSKYEGGIHYLLVDEHGRSVDLEGNQLPSSEKPYYLSKSDFQFIPATSTSSR